MGSERVPAFKRCYAVQLVRIEAAQQNDQAVCLGCGGMFYAREG